LIVVLFVNVLLEIDSGASIVRVVAIGALTTLSIPTMAIIASTAIMTERKLERASKITSKTSKSFGTSESTKIGRPSQHRDTVFAYMDTIYNSEQRVATFKELKDHTGLSEATVSRLRNLWISEKGLSK
jgi:ABC-type transport system involved in cytochrome bd biosynthesis fused ATPase/permease subunit